MTRFQFKPESGKKQKRADKRVKERDDRGHDDRFPQERYSPEHFEQQGRKGKMGGRGGSPDRSGRFGVKGAGKSSGLAAGSKQGGRLSRGAPGTRNTFVTEAPIKDEFSALIRETADAMDLSARLDPEPAPLALLDYPTELELKNASIRKWWTHHAIPDKPTLVIPSPLPRHYRSTTKRRLVRKGEEWRYDFFLERLGGIAKAGIDSLEPASHEAVYKFALEKLNEDSYRNLANSINFLIVRGDTELMVIFNVFRLNADVVRKAKLLGEHLARLTERPATAHVKVIAAHIFFDKTRSDYYLEARVSEGAFRLKRLFGPEFLPITVNNQRFLLHPTGFFQVNTSILPRLIAEVQNALKPQKTDRLLDLYCGCGLFTLPVAQACAQAWGVEGSPVSIEAAQRAAGAAGPATVRNTRFTAGRIDAKSLPRLLPPADGTPEIILLDPPRQGTAPGVIPLLAARQPRRVVYLFCDMNIMPVEINKWRKQGYMLAKAMPFDMFPGTNNLEMLVVLLPDKYGVLNRKKPKVEAVDEEELTVGSGQLTVNTKRTVKAGNRPSSKSGYQPKSKSGDARGKTAQGDGEARPKKFFKPRADGGAGRGASGGSDRGSSKGSGKGPRQVPSTGSPFSGSYGTRGADNSFKKKGPPKKR
jgi:tRNA/tmRNA/rRNA uracil-C5-methylase (TrmA/RlmC/RlmD family)